MSLQSIQQAFDDLMSGSDMSLNSLSDSAMPMSSGNGLQVYFDNSRGALRQALVAAYPVCRQVVGEQYFNQVAALYIQNHPMQCPDLNLYGESLPELLRELCLSREELLALHYLPDLAQLEQLLHRAYFASPRITFDSQACAALKENQLMQSTMTLADDIGLLQSGFDVVSIWQFHHAGQKTRSIDAETLPLKRGSFYYLIHRAELKPEIVRINAKDWEFLHLIEAGLSLDDICDVMQKKGVELPAVTDFIINGWVGGLSHPQE
jgi:hypothetical protein